MPPDATGSEAGAAPASGARTALAGLSLAELTEIVTALGAPRYRAAQVHRAYWQEGRPDFAAMSTLPPALRETLATRLDPAVTTALETAESEDGTVKWLLGLSDGRRIETVLIPEGERATVCVSTQVGCPIGCVFCASGVGGVVRDLTAAEIAEQVLHVRRRLGKRPTHVVVMGMGEPLLNLENLARAIERWTDEQGLGFSPRRITVSTAGTPAAIERLAAKGLGVQLAISLHGPDDPVRRRLVPGSPAGRVSGLIDAAARYARDTGRDATAEYVLIAGENDALEHADSLASALEGRHIHVNLIPLNPVRHRPDLRAPAPAVSRAFAARLKALGVSATLRTQRGDDIAAACGQLALERSGVVPQETRANAGRGRSTPS
jgi:23S rRNA (adenine2503-C2)-methyltransferase